METVREISPKHSANYVKCCSSVSLNMLKKRSRLKFFSDFQNFLSIEHKKTKEALKIVKYKLSARILSFALTVVQKHFLPKIPNSVERSIT